MKFGHPGIVYVLPLLLGGLWALSWWAGRRRLSGEAELKH